MRPSFLTVYVVWLWSSCPYTASYFVYCQPFMIQMFLHAKMTNCSESCCLVSSCPSSLPNLIFLLSQHTPVSISHTFPKAIFSSDSIFLICENFIIEDILSCICTYHHSFINQTSVAPT